MGKYNIYVTPAAELFSKRITGDADKVRESANNFETHSDLTRIGKRDLFALAEGRAGDTMLGGALKQSAARANAGVTNSYGLGATAMAGNAGPNSGLVYCNRAARNVEK